jgi:Fusaric acid resistance protein-like
MQRSVVIGQTRRGGPGPWWSRLPVPLQPASSGPVRYWQDRGRLAAKCALAAVAAWALARYAAGQHDPYFAPLAALAGVSPTVARSLREGIQYVAGFVLGAVLAIPVAVVLGPSIAGIVVIVLAGVVIGSWRRLGGQSTQVTFTALFVLLIGGYQPLHYLTPRLIDVGIGVVTGLAVNVLVFPPLQLRPAEHAVRQWGDDVAAALEDLADAAAGRYSPGQSWPRHERRLSTAAEQARAATRNARESLRWNPRAKVERAVPRPDGVVFDSLEELTARTRAVARVLLDAAAGDESLSLPASFGESYAAMLRTLTGPVRQLADLRSAPPDRDELAGASGCQDHVERQAGQLAGSTGNENTARHLADLSRQLVNELARKSGDRN